MGRVQAATATAYAIRRWRPRYILLVGIAGGIAARNVRVGDILISDQIVDYELQKLTSQGPEIRWEVQRADSRLLDACNNYRDERWQELIQIKRPDTMKSTRHTGPIASGDKVIAFGEVLARYRDVWPKLIGVEMEAAGVATAAFQSSDKPGFFMVRGVSDLADENKGSSDVKKWRLYACAAVASFAVALLKNGPVPLTERPIKTQRIELILEGEFSEFTSTRLRDIVGVLAALLRTDPGNIKILKAYQGSIVLIIEMPDSVANRLYEMATARDFRIVSLGAESVLAEGREIIKLANKTVWEIWNWKSTDGKELIGAGVVRDILLGLGTEFPESGFSETNRDIICSLANSIEDRRLQTAVRFWEKLWLLEPGLPYSPLMKLLATAELSGEMYSKYRDHVVHTVWQYLLGLYLYQQNKPIRQAILGKFSAEEFLSAWKIASLFHDVGYTFDKGIDYENEILKPILEELQKTIDFPLRQYLQVRSVNLSENEESELMQLAGRFVPKILSLNTIEFLPRPGEKRKTLDLIEDWAIPTLLAQERQQKPLQGYYELGKKEKPKGRERFRDHGILSALLLLYQFDYVDSCLGELKSVELPERLSRGTREELGRIISPSVTQSYTKVVYQAATAIALHNVNVEIWDIDKTKEEPYSLSLQDYRISLEESPLAFLLAFTDVLQCWDRPKRKYQDTSGGLSIRNQDVHITCKDDLILWSVEPDDPKTPQISPTQEIETMSKYMSFRGKKDLFALIKEG
jgi:nucleoside phosphorylase